MPIYEMKDYSTENNNLLLHDQLINNLGLKREPVGVSFYFSEEEYKQGEFEETDYKMAYCVFVEKASRKGLCFKTKLENHYCDGGTTALGLEEANEDIKSGRVYYSYGLYKTKGIAKKVWKEVPAIKNSETPVYGISIGPLKNFKTNPDIVIVIGDALSMMRIVQANLYNTGERMSLDVSAMQGMCSEITAIPYLTNNINISILCPSTRMLSKWNSSELAAGIPYSLLEEIISGVEAVKDK